MENFWVAEESEGIGEAVRRQLGERDRRTAAGGSPWLLVVSPGQRSGGGSCPLGAGRCFCPAERGGCSPGWTPRRR